MQEKHSNGLCNIRKGISAVLTLMPILSFQATSVLALDADFGNDVKLSMDTSLSYSSAWRVQNPDSALLTSTGNANFDKWDQTLSALSVGIDTDLNWKGDYGVFLRGRGLYDTVYTEDKFLPKAQDRHGKDVELLDAFFYSSFTPADLPVTLRIGRQAIFWGESLLVFGSIATAQNPLDTTKANAPGVEAKEIILPTGQIYGQISTANSKATLASYYKWEWEESRLDENGTYFSTNDALDNAGEFLMGVIPRGVDQDAKDGGEYGVALRYLADNGDEFGLYFLNYHENMPLLNINNFMTAGVNYNLEYQEDVKLYGATYSTVFGGTNVAAEISYRDNLKVGMATALPSYKEAQFLQAQVSLFHIFGDIWIADSAVLAAEWGYNEVLDFDDDELAQDKRATGGQFKFTMDYFDIASGLDMKVPIALAYNPLGNTSYAISGFNEDSNSVSIGADFTYLGVYQVGIAYTAFLGDAEDNNKTDRDFVALNLKYTF